MYTHLIVMKNAHGMVQSKEFLDIALVSASYEIPTAVFFSDIAVQTLGDNTSAELLQIFNMMAEFEIPLFGEHSTVLQEQALGQHSLSALKENSQHILVF